MATLREVRKIEPAVEHEFHGFLEVVTDSYVSGWCQNRAAPSQRVELEILLDDRVVGVAHCNRMRDDLLAHAIGDGMHGFYLTLSGLAGGLDQLRARVKHLNVEVPRVAAGTVSAAAEPIVEPGPEEASPIMGGLPADVLEAVPDTLGKSDTSDTTGKSDTSDAAAPIFEKPSMVCIDKVSAGGIVGWINENDATRKIVVEVWHEDRLLKSHSAALVRPDVQGRGLGAGSHGFHVPIPEACFDGALRTLTLRIPILEETLVLPLDAQGLRVFEAGAFQTEHGLVSGALDLTALGRERASVTIFVDDAVLAALPVERGATGNASFKLELPLEKCDGAEHSVRAFIDDSPYCLRAADGALSATFRRSLKGKIDRIDSAGMGGWAYDIEHPEQAITLSVYDGASLVASFDTSIVRNDVNKSFGISGVHGFVFPFPAYLYDGQEHHFSIVYQGQTLNRKATLPFPITLTSEHFAEVKGAARFEGTVDNVTATQVSGWACDNRHPDQPVRVAIYVDDAFAGSALANRFASRLRGGHRHGHHLFLFKFPTHFMNGKKRSIRAVVMEGNYELPNRFSSVLFPLFDYFGNLPQDQRSGQFNYTAPPLAWRPTGESVPLTQPAEGAPMLSIITLNWNGAGVLRDFLASFRSIDWRYSYEIILIDHGSTDDSLLIAAEFADLPLRLVERGANYSFSASNNLGAQMARAPYLVFANNDLVMLHDCFAQMLRHLADPTVGAVGVKLLEPLRHGGNQWQYHTHHQSVHFHGAGLLPGTAKRYYVPMEHGESLTADLAVISQVPAVTGALLLARASDFAALGGFHEGYFYGMEDIDLCLGIGLKLGKKVIADTSVTVLHNRSATRDSKLTVSEREKMYNARIHAGNRALYVSRFGRRVTSHILKSLVRGEQFWRTSPLRVVFVVTEANMATKAGDFFTAVELAEAMRRLHGWETLFVPMATYDLAGADVVIVMRHDYHIQKATDLNPGAVVVAWARNRIDQWVAAPYFDAYHLIFCSSRKAIDHVRQHTGRESYLLPIATNAQRFSPTRPAAAHVSDVTFTGSYWASQREAIDLQDMGNVGYQFAMYGYGWGEVPKWRPHWRGAVPYAALPEIYSSAKLVLDDSHPVTRVWNSLNSRVFDAIGCGRLVLTNCHDGAQELFPGLLPTFQNAQELRERIDYYLAHPQEREELAQRLRNEVIQHHTYDNRATAFKDGLAGFVGGSLRFAIKIGVPNLAERDSWGDYHFALGIKRALERQGHFVRIDLLPDWENGYTAGDDVVIVLRGLSQYQPQPTAINLMWLISHPDDVSLTEYQRYDHVFVASEPFTRRLAERLGERVSPLLQCTDPELFYKDVDDELDVKDVIFVGNSRGQRREVVQYALDQQLDFEVYGGMWGTMLPASRIKANYIPNQELRRYYSSAKVVLNDHWSDMRSEGFVSNRLFDAGACGAAIVTDEMAACRDLFGDDVHYYDSAATLSDVVHGVLADTRKRQRRSERLQKLIREKHTFDQRVGDILAMVRRLSEVR